MQPVFPYLVRRSEDGGRGELLLRLKGGKSAYIFHLSLEQARALAVEMRGLASNLCPQHHMTVMLAQSLGGTISHLVIRYVGSNNETAGEIRMLTKMASTRPQWTRRRVWPWRSTWVCPFLWMATSTWRTANPKNGPASSYRRLRPPSPRRSWT